MPIVTRQEIAELFFMLAALLIMNRYPQASKKAALLLVFIGSMVVSHYSTSYIFLFYLGIFWVGSAFLTRRTRQKRTQPAISATIVVLAVVITLGWYIFAGAGTVYAGFVSVGHHTYQALSTDLFTVSRDPAVQAGLGAAVQQPGFFDVLGHYWQLATEVFIVTGLASVIWRRKTPKMSPQLLLFSLASLSLLVIVVVLPTVGGEINTWRSYSFALFFLAPSCILGVEVVVETASGWLGANRGLIVKLTSVALIVLLVPYFLLNYGFADEIANKPANYAFLPTQNSIGRSILYTDNVTVTFSYVNFGRVPIESDFASTWLSDSRGESTVHADWIRAPELAAYGNVSPDSINLNITAPHVPSNAYIYLGPANVQQQSIQSPSGEEISISAIPQLAVTSRVYDNGLCEVYRT